MWGTLLVAAGGLVAVLFVLKPLYVKYVRKDVSVSPEDKPVLARLKRPVHGSHRGGSKSRPENTMVAFKYTVYYTDDTGANKPTQMLEFDIQETKDGHLVIMHNDSVDATTNGKGPISSFTLAQIRDLDAGYHFTTDNGLTYPYRGKGVQVPTLEELLEEFAPAPDLVFYMDFKYPGAVGPSMDMVRRYGIEERLIVGAIPGATNKEVLRLKPPCAVATPDFTTMIVAFACYCVGLLWLVPMKHEIAGITPYFKGVKVISKRLVDAFHDRGCWFIVFGDYLDTKDGQLDILAMGCDILNTDRPEVLHDTLDAWNRELAFDLV